MSVKLSEIATTDQIEDDDLMVISHQIPKTDNYESQSIKYQNIKDTIKNNISVELKNQVFNVDDGSSVAEAGFNLVRFQILYEKKSDGAEEVFVMKQK